MVSEFENPWRRLPWTLSSAFIAWLLLMWLFGAFFSRPQLAPLKQKPIDAKLIEIPAPKPAPSSASPRPRIIPRPAPVKPAAKPAPPEKPAPQAKPAPPSKPAPPAPAQPPMQDGNAMGARAIYSPKPVIPDEFRQDAMDVLVVARFHIAEDGSAKVELIIATPLPGLNQAVLDTLNTWKFFPALQKGKPVASTQDIRFRLQVKW